MRSISFIQTGKCFGGVLLPAIFLLSTGCGDSQVKTYRVAKEDNTPKIPQAHSADDGHDHSGHGHGEEMTTAGAAVPKVTWDLPTGWQALPADGMRKGIFQISGPDAQMAQVMIIPLPGVSNIELQSVNMWREELGLEALTKEQVTTQAQSVEVGDAKGELFDMATLAPKAGQKFKTRTLGAIAERESVLWFAKMTGADELVAGQKKAFVDFLKSLKFEKGEASATAATSAAAPPAAAAGGPSWAVPANWQQKAAGPMVMAAYTVTGADGQGDVSISKFPGDVGGLAANVNRWRDQLGLQRLAEGDVKQSTEMMEIDGRKEAYVVDLKGMNARTGKSARMVAVGVPRGGETWFYKLLGDDALVGREKDTFLKFVVSAH